MLFKKKEIEILAPFDGEMVDIKTVDEENFSICSSSIGVAIIPEQNEIYAPVSGEVTTLFPTLHLVGITTKEEIEVLIHVGINTVNLGRMGFEAKICNNAVVRKGNLLLTADINMIRKLGYNIITPILICNYRDYEKIIFGEYGKVKKGDVIMKIIL